MNKDEEENNIEMKRHDYIIPLEALNSNLPSTDSEEEECKSETTVKTPPIDLQKFVLGSLGKKIIKLEDKVNELIEINENKDRLLDSQANSYYRDFAVLRGKYAAMEDKNKYLEDEKARLRDCAKGEQYQTKMAQREREETERERQRRINLGRKNSNLEDEIEELKEELEKISRKPNTDHVKLRMKDTLNSIRHQQDFIDCKCQIEGYQGHNSKLKKHMRERLVILDERYGHYGSIINNIQISIIVTSTCAAFIQASASTTNLHSSQIAFITLCISTYTGLLLALSKYMKFDEKKEGIHSLQQQFAEFITQIETREDQLNTWCSDNFWAGHPPSTKRKEWLELEDTLKAGFKLLIERKSYLCCEFEKEMDTGAQQKIHMYARSQELNMKRQKNKMDIQDAKLKRDELHIKLRIKDVAQEMEEAMPDPPLSPTDNYVSTNLMGRQRVGGATQPNK